MKIVVTRSARKSLARLQPAMRDRVSERIAALAKGERADVQAVMGRRGTYRLRVGDYRVIFAVAGGVIEIIDIAHRRVAYR